MLRLHGLMGSSESLRQKIDAMRSEISRMQQSLDAVLADKNHRPQEARATAVEKPPSIPNEEQQAAQTLLSVNKPHDPPSATSGSATSPAGLSGREDNTQMAMTRENSLEPLSSGDQGNGPVTVEDPMGSLFEVTRLRNIRSNKSKTSRPQQEVQGELNDFISRGVIREAEAIELYEM